MKIGAGSLIIIEKGELHQIVNTGKQVLRSINFYAPPAYDEQGEPVGRLRRMLGAIG